MAYLTEGLAQCGVALTTIRSGPGARDVAQEGRRHMMFQVLQNLTGSQSGIHPVCVWHDRDGSVFIHGLSIWNLLQRMNCSTQKLFGPLASFLGLLKELQQLDVQCIRKGQ